VLKLVSLPTLAGQKQLHIKIINGGGIENG